MDIAQNTCQIAVYAYLHCKESACHHQRMYTLPAENVK